MNFYFRDEVLPYYGGGTIAARTCAGNDFMYWEVMRRAADRGFRLFDFGRSKNGTGAYSFKRNWGFVPEKLHYRYRLARRCRDPRSQPDEPEIPYIRCRLEAAAVADGQCARAIYRARAWLAWSRRHQAVAAGNAAGRGHATAS